MARQVTFEITVKDKATGELKTIETKAKTATQAFAKLSDNAKTASAKIAASTKNAAAATLVFDGLASAVQQLTAMCADLAAAYDAQIMAEEKLATIMQQRMAATAEDIQGIKDLCAAQQQLGVIGDEVQLAGAQQVATFLQSKESLATLIPAMNNLLAQQKGLNATQQDAVNIGNMVGKVMQGQISALTRAGITFTEAQKQVLQYGTEEERAATLAQVITDNVGNMNARLAQTDSGKMQQLRNALGDVKEQIGGFAKSALPFLTMSSQATVAAMGIAKVVTAVKALTVAFRALNTVTKASILGAVVAVVAALVGWMSSLSDETEEAAAQTKRLQEEQDRLRQRQERLSQLTQSQVAEFERYKSLLANFNGTQQEQARLVAELNNKYGEQFGVFKTLSEWYQTLTKNSEAYCRQIEAEARVRLVSEDIADLTARHRQTTRALDADPTTANAPSMFDPTKTVREQVEELYQAQLKQLRAEMDAIFAEMPKPMLSTGAGGGTGGSTSALTMPTEFKTLQDFDNALAYLNQQLLTATADQVNAVRAKIEQIRRMREQFGQELGEIVKLTNKAGLQLGDGAMPDGLTINNPLAPSGWSAIYQQVQELSKTDNFDRLKQSMTGVAAAMKNISDMCAQGGSAWLQYGANILSAVASAIPAITALAHAEGIEASQRVPWPLNIIALGASVAAIAAAVANIPKFADGGLVYGKTTAIVGEYAGAGSNPEVIAPLSKLRNILGDTGTAADGKVQFEISERTLRGVLNKSNKYTRRT